MAKNTNTEINYEGRAAAEPTELQKAYAEWLYVKTGVRVDLKSVQLACAFRADYQASPENQKALAEKKANAAAARKASAARKKAKLEAELAKLKAAEAPVVEPVKDEAQAAYDAAFEKARALGGDHGEAADAGKRAKELFEKNATVASSSIDPVKLTVVYGNGDPEVHKFGCNDLKKMTKAKGYTKETETVSSHTELTKLIYADQIDGGEASVEQCYMSYETKPCCPALDS